LLASFPGALILNDFNRIILYPLKQINALITELHGFLMKYKRPSWDETFMGIVYVVSKRGTCDRGRNAAVVARGKQILSFGYVGSPSGEPHCDDVGHLIRKVTHGDGSESYHCVRTDHAEKNAIKNAKSLRLKVKGATLYTKMTPCIDCANAIKKSGIEKVVCVKKYHRLEGEEILNKAGVKIVYLTDELMKYKKQ